jgi:hypothetical protein
MILDEPVASLDPEGERAVFQLFAELHHKIIIFTTHRYDSIPPETPIVVLVDGRISEAGTHEELLQRQQDYWSLYTSGSSIARGVPSRRGQLDGGRPLDGARPGATRLGPTSEGAKHGPTWEGALPPRAAAPPRSLPGRGRSEGMRLNGTVRRGTWRSADVR